MTTLPTWQPPPHYIPLESALPGITLYAPRPTGEAATPAPISFKCPRCGAATKFDVAAGSVACEHCGYLAQVQAPVVGAAAAQAEFTLEALQKAEKGWGVERQELHCESCGAEMTLAAETLSNRALTATCPFCASNNVNLRAAQTDALRPTFLIPFKMTAEAAHTNARTWLGRGWFHPEALAQAASLSRFTGTYLPYWTFSTKIDASWKAEVGYERSESYYDSDDKEWKTRTVVDWRWESGRVHVPLDNWLVPGTSRTSNFLLQNLLPFQLADLTAYAPDFLAGWQALAYDVLLPKAWETGKAAMREEAKSACYRDTGSSRVRSFSMAADFADESWRYILLPVYLTAYKFETQAYQVLVNGQTGKVAGQKPVAWWKVWLAVGLLFAPTVLCSCAGLVGLPFGGVGIIGFAFAAAFLVLAIVASVYIFNQATQSEKA